MEEREILLTEAMETLLLNEDSSKLKSVINKVKNEGLTTLKFVYRNGNTNINFKKIELKIVQKTVECKIICGVSYVLIKRNMIIKMSKDLKGTPIERLANAIKESI